MGVWGKFFSPKLALRPAFAALTRLAEEYGLFVEPHRIGTRNAWLKRIEAAGLVVQGAKLVHQNEAVVNVVRHRTAITRRDLSQPVQTLVTHRILTQADTVFDYGCGQGDDVAALAANGFQAHGWDPHYAPDGPRRPADVVNLGFVLNVIEDRHKRAETLTAAFRFAKRALCVAVMPISKYSFGALRPHGDGCLTARSTFQKYFAQQELREFIAETLGDAPIAFAPGIFVVFRDKDLEQEVLFRRQVRDITRHSGWYSPERPSRPINVRPELVERIGAELQMLWAAIVDRGRVLDVDEVSSALRERLRATNVSIGPATDLCLSDSVSRDEFAAAAAARKDDLLIHLALTLFPGAPRYTTLARSIQRDTRAFFGGHAAGMQEANALLFSVGKVEVVRQAVSPLLRLGSAACETQPPSASRLPP